MKILWVKNDFLHPTNRGGQIRTLETLRRLHARHEIHYVAYNQPNLPEGVRRAGEYCSVAYPVDKPVPARGSLPFFTQLAANFFSPLPLAVGRFRSEAMIRQIQSLLAAHHFDVIVCDFLAISQNIPDLSRAVLFQHNVETMIWRRHADNAPDPLRRAYFRTQADRMFRCEQAACRAARHVIAVSEKDAVQMRELFGIQHVTPVETGVDLDYFQPPLSGAATTTDLVFVGAMDWLPNIDGIRYFVSDILPRIRRTRPDCSLVIAGRSPVPEILELARKDSRIQVTGTVPDIRPHLWSAAVSIVPLRIGGGTRLKIYEAMAAGIPVVSTSIGAEGLDVASGVDIELADTAEEFAFRCVSLLESAERREAQSGSALQLVRSRFSWDHVSHAFESILQNSWAAYA